ncbi:ABC-2 type transport system permease protein [Actinoplanes lutulentus]|uniref:Transport permease protein n=1 Tax=Actinoplanes lutulentus TaxID=1287878 RepID=A0A327ZDE8_9ACTN|nr:ABC transporter permease [Actinoplanes lutulentus]MBB2942591.1 ABC-2 type transport system permease protein [Actinoplanes lutulentus]RAK38172.1 ABC-2 type transport system permease protein [Actinoplanes lutulentus]
MNTSLSRGHVELLQFFRDKTALVFTFAFPAMLLLLFGTIFGDQYNDAGVSASRVFTASMIAYGVLNTAFVTMGAGLAMDREDGTLKRLRGTPMPVSAYLVGKALLVLALSLAETALLLLVGVLVFDMPLPDASHWLTFTWIFLLSVIACSLLGVAVSALVRNARNAGAILNVPVVALQFISGVFIQPMSQLPDWLVNVASIFPVRWMAQGFRYVFLPESASSQELAGSWELGKVALVLGVWCVVGLVLCLMTFRWSDSDR